MQKNDTNIYLIISFGLRFRLRLSPEYAKINKLKRRICLGRDMSYWKIKNAPRMRYTIAKDLGIVCAERYLIVTSL